MRAASVDLVAYLATADAVDVADLLTITLANGGGVLRLTNYDVDLTVAGQLYSAAPSQYQRGLVKVGVGLAAEPIKITLTPDPFDLVAGLTWQAAAQRGLFDGARVSVDKIIMPSPRDTSLGSVNLFTGGVADVEADRLTLELTCKSDVQLLDTPWPRNVYQPSCANTLFDGVCTLSRAAFTVATTAGAGSTANNLTESALSNPTGYFDLGTVTMTSGALAGQERPIKRYTAGSPNTIELLRPFTAAPAPGDTMNVVPGCNKLQTTCDTKFANLAHFRGEPYIPPPEQAQ